MRKSERRTRVLEVISGYGKHMTVEHVHCDVNKQEPKISLATVYRNLNQLADNGLITKVHEKDQRFFFDGNPERHYHLHCKECDGYYDVPVAYQNELDAQVSNKLGCVIEFHSITFEGICKDCQRQ